MQITEKNWVVWATASSGALSDVHVEVTAASTGLDNDEGFGLVCGFSDNAHFYYLGFTPEGYYAIIKTEGDIDTVLNDPNHTWLQSMRVARRAESYRVGADCRSDGTLTLSVDGLEVATATDTSYPDGSIGLFARTFDLAPAEPRCDDLVVTALQ